MKEETRETVAYDKIEARRFNQVCRSLTEISANWGMFDIAQILGNDEMAPDILNFVRKHLGYFLAGISRELWDNLATGMGKRAEALGVIISTQAADDLHFLGEMLDAEPDSTVHVQLHSAPNDCALDDRKAWAAANPALGVVLNEDQFADAAARATRSIASARDLCAFSLWFPDSGWLLTWHWVPSDTIGERVERDRVPYDRWADEGWMESTPGRATDRVAIARRLADVRQSYDVRGIAFDRWRFEDLGKLLSDKGIDLPLVEFIPGFKSYAPAVDAFERAVLDRRMRHNGNPLMRWQAGNAIIETDPAGNRKPTKAKSLDRIDGIVTAIMACGLAERHEGRERGSPGFEGWKAKLLRSSVWI